MWQLYLLATLDGWSGALQIIAFLCVLAALLSLLFAAMTSTEAEDITSRVAKTLYWAAPLLVFTILLGAAIPSSKNAWIMAGAYVATNTEGVAELPPNVLAALNRFLEQYVEEEVEP